MPPSQSFVHSFPTPPHFGECQSIECYERVSDSNTVVSIVSGSILLSWTLLLLIYFLFHKCIMLNEIIVELNFFTYGMLPLLSRLCKIQSLSIHLITFHTVFFTAPGIPCSTFHLSTSPSLSLHCLQCRECHSWPGWQAHYPESELFF